METGLIKVLPQEVVDKIAAGEVVERPSSVVKELVENSIDAGARHIEVEVKDGGLKLVEITDDGAGMSQQDAVLAFSPHATSKIKSEEDLEILNTLGFRGEALATIAAVSRVTLVTKAQVAPCGTRVNIEGGRIIGVDADQIPRGTRIQVKNLFFNVPARRKFLKSQQVEMAQISDIVCHYILGYPELAFKFTRNNIPLATSTGSGNLLDSIISVYGPQVAKTLVPLKEGGGARQSGFDIRGFISMPNEARPSPRYMTVMVNRRFVRSKLVSQAIAKALSAFFPKGRYPVLVLDIRMPPELVDVNVHPQKTEVRFRDERSVFGAVWDVVQSSLSGLSMLPPSGTGSDTGLLGNDPAQVRPGSLGDQAQKHGETYPDGGSLRENRGSEENLQGSLFPHFGPSAPRPMPDKPRIYDLGETAERLGPASVAGPFEPVKTLSEPRILGQLLQSYLLGEDREGMFIVDQHAAHERVLFDTYIKAYRDTRIASQQLLFPIPLKLLPSERMIVKERGGEFRELGFSIHEEEDGQYYATAVPILNGKPGDSEIIQELLGAVLGNWETRTVEEIKGDLLKMMACKNAVKAGDPLLESEMKSLLEQLLKTPNPFTCPHGRPVALRITSKAIERSFLRT